MANKKALYSVTLKFTSAKQLSNFLSSKLPLSCEIVDHSAVKKPTPRRRKVKKTPPAGITSTIPLRGDETMVVNIENIAGRVIDGKEVCLKCHTPDEEIDVSVDALILRSDLERDDERLVFCDRCKKQIK
jgi:hypothetical protein